MRFGLSSRPREVDMPNNLKSPAPLPIRLVFGAYFTATGFCQLGGLGLYCLKLGALSSFLKVCHDNFFCQIGGLGVWWPGGVGTGIGLIEFVGGLGLFFGAFVTTAA